MDLISREAAIEALGERPENWTDTPAEIETVRSYDNAIDDLKSVPSVPAVPLDKLCEWLNVHCGRPNYCNDRLCGECNLDGEGFEYEPCWKTLLTEWMEEQDGTDNP
jgi:hypothetical protein